MSKWAPEEIQALHDLFAAGHPYPEIARRLDRSTKQVKYRLHVLGLGRAVGRPEDAAARFWRKVDRRGPDECWLWQGSCFDNGYGQFSIYPRNVKAHRFSYELAHGPIPTGFAVMHSCDNPPCVNPAHLTAGSLSDNMQDAIAKGRDRPPRGELNGMAKLNDALVREMRAAYAAGEGRGALAARFGVSRTNVDLVVTGKAWASVT